MIIYTQEEIKVLLKENPDRYYVYGLCRPDTNEIFYIGKGKNWRTFVHLDLRYTTGNKHKDRIVAKIGPVNIKFLIKFVNSEEDAFEFEKKLISRYKEQLTNLTDGGEGTSGYRHREDSKLKMSVTSKIFYSTDKGKEVTKRTANIHRGMKQTEEAKRKISESLRKTYLSGGS
jgi:hypothetical protein